MSSEFPSIQRIPTECCGEEGGGAPQGRGLMGMVMVISASESDSWLLLSGSEPFSQLDVKAWGCVLLSEVVSTPSCWLRCRAQLCAAVICGFPPLRCSSRYICGLQYTWACAEESVQSQVNKWRACFCFSFLKYHKPRMYSPAGSFDLFILLNVAQYRSSLQTGFGTTTQKSLLALKMEEVQIPRHAIDAMFTEKRDNRCTAWPINAVIDSELKHWMTSCSISDVALTRLSRHNKTPERGDTTQTQRAQIKHFNTFKWRGTKSHRRRDERN